MSNFAVPLQSNSLPPQRTTVDRDDDQWEKEDSEQASFQGLFGTKTNDAWFYSSTRNYDSNGNQDPSRPAINPKVLFTGSLVVFVLLCLSFGFLWLSIEPTLNLNQSFDHNKVRLSFASSTCNYERSCTDFCTSIEVEHQQGCCIGCGLATDCNFNVTVNWYNVPRLLQRQRIFLLVTLDGNDFYQTGYAPFVEGGVDGEAVIADGCFSESHQYVAVVGCLTSLDLQDDRYHGFPLRECNSTWGICIPTNQVFLAEPSFCHNGLWIGNGYEETWLGVTYSAGGSMRDLNANAHVYVIGFILFVMFLAMTTTCGCL